MKTVARWLLAVPFVVSCGDDRPVPPVSMPSSASSASASSPPAVAPAVTATASSTTASTASADPAPSASDTVPAQKSLCPLRIVPGVGIGPVRIGQRREELTRLDVPLRERPDRDPSSRHEVVYIGPVSVSLCDGIVEEVWMDDIRKAHPCVEVAGKRVSPVIDPKKMQALFEGCGDVIRRLGGNVVECEGGTLRLVTGGGTYLMARVGKRGVSLDSICGFNPFAR